MQFKASWQDRILTRSPLITFALTFGIATAVAADRLRQVEPDCIGAVADTAVSVAREAGGPNAFAALPEQSRDVALRLFMAQNAIAGRAKPYLSRPDHTGSAPRGTACPTEVAVAIATRCVSDDSCWTLERISAERHAASGWGQVFHDMHQAGLLDLRKLLSVWNPNRASAESLATSGGNTPAR